MLSGLIMGFVMLMAMSITAVASDSALSSKEYLDSLNVGVATILDPSAGKDLAARDSEERKHTESQLQRGTVSGSSEAEADMAEKSAAGEGTLDSNGQDSAAESGTKEAGAAESGNNDMNDSAAAKKEEKKTQSNLVMADVQNALNVRSEANEESEKVGVLYRDCGGKVLERKDGWTKLQSGDLIGWASDDYLLFEEDAEALAEEVGNLIVTIETDALRIRKEPSTEAGVFALMAQDDELDVIEVIDKDWISVEYDDNIGYVSSEFVNMDFHIDEGETVAAIKAREKAEAEAKAKLTANQGAVVAGADDTRLLGALIYCESGNQTYEGQLAVGAAVMNRVRSGAYPNSISGVIYASGQFPPALNGKVARAYERNVPESCLQAAAEAINGASNIGTATHFKRVGAHEGVVIGDHVFW